MIKRIIVFYNLVFAPVLLVLSSFQMQPKPVAEIVLRDEPAGFTPTRFYIDRITDERKNTTAVAYFLPMKVTEAGAAKLYPVDLKGGGFTAVRRFINRNLACNTSLRAVNVTLKKLEIIETEAAGGNADGHMNVTFSFSMPDQFNEDKDLIDYYGNASYKRKPGNPQEVEPALRHLLIGGLAYFNTWINKQADNDIRFASEVKVFVKDAPKEKVERDSIIYDAGRPLTWDDFQSTVPNSRFDAEVFPSFGYNEITELNSGFVNVEITVKVFLPKSSSWVKQTTKSTHTLNHEQRHFDITKIIAERFKKKLRAKKVSLIDYEAVINEVYLDCYRDLHTMELQYDSETRHGTYEQGQERWNQKIDGELKKLGII